MRRAACSLRAWSSITPGFGRSTPCCAREVFGQARLIVVSQRFHTERAVYLARAHGIEAFGFNARGVGGAEGVRVLLREVVSRVAAVLDVELLRTRPRFLGPSVRIPAA